MGFAMNSKLENYFITLPIYCGEKLRFDSLLLLRGSAQRGRGRGCAECGLRWRVVLAQGPR